MTIAGKIRYSDLEGGGIWLVDTDQGECYELEGLPSAFQKDGAAVELEGAPEQQGVTIGMMGALFKVSKARAR